MSEWDGIKRRSEDTDTEHRLTVLDESSKQAKERHDEATKLADKRHEENQKSLVAVHRRITDLQRDFSEQLSRGVDAILETVKEHERVRCTACDKHEERTSSLEASRDYAKGVIKAVGIGLPAAGSVAWFMLKIGSVFGKHGGAGP